MTDFIADAGTGSMMREASISPGVGQPPEGGQPANEHTASLWADAGRELVRNPVFILSTIAALMITSMAAVPSLWTSANPRSCPLSMSKHGPSADHVFGNTMQGCDMYAQVIYGARPSILIAVFATLGVVVVGGVTGMVSGYYGGLVDAVISRIVDVFMGLPFLLGALTVLALLQSHSVWAVVLAMAALGWPQVSRIMRGSVLSTRSMDYVQAARSLGASDDRIIVRHVLPNAVAPVIVVATILLGQYVAVEATLTFLGVGLKPPSVSWGLLITEGQKWVFSGFPHLLLFPVSFLVTTVLAFILMGDAVRDALDPKLR